MTTLMASTVMALDEYSAGFEAKLESKRGARSFASCSINPGLACKRMPETRGKREVSPRSPEASRGDWLQSDFRNKDNTIQLVVIVAPRSEKYDEKTTDCAPFSRSLLGTQESRGSAVRMRCPVNLPQP